MIKVSMKRSSTWLQKIQLMTIATGVLWKENRPMLRIGLSSRGILNFATKLFLYAMTYFQSRLETKVTKQPHSGIGASLATFE